ncbi:MAG: hypothetical protein WDA11_10540 [Thiohalomonadaceae bacterium]
MNSLSPRVLVPVAMLLWSTGGVSAETVAEPEPKVISGISIVGNNETPKSLVIVPWKGSDVGNDGELASRLLDGGFVPVDKEVFMRELRYYELSNP